MATFSNYLNLKLNAPNDPFLLSDFVSNWQILDANPGIFITTSGARPSYTSAQSGRLIFLTDLKQFQWWNGTAWQTDALYAPPIFHGGVSLNQVIARNTTTTPTVLTFSISRPCSVGIILTAEYAMQARQYQELFQAITVDGVFIATGFREHAIVSAENVSHTAFYPITSAAALTTLAAGSHTIGVQVQVQNTTSASVTLDGAKCIVFVSNYTVNNAF